MIPNVRLINCKAEIGLNLFIDADSVDLVVTSPPYTSILTPNVKSALRESADYNANYDFKKIASELVRVLKPGGVIVWVIGDSVSKGSETGESFRQALYFRDELKLNLHDTMIYEKDAFPFPDKSRYYQQFEYMFAFSKGKPKTVNLIADKKNTEGGKTKKISNRNADCTINNTDKLVTIKEFGVRGNIWKYGIGYMKTTTDKLAFEHPAMFPEELARDHILSWSNPGDTVLDPFAGSGTVLKQAFLNGRNAIGIEISKRYFDLAKNRLETYIEAAKEKELEKCSK